MPSREVIIVNTDSTSWRILKTILSTGMIEKTSPETALGNVTGEDAILLEIIEFVIRRLLSPKAWGWTRDDRPKRLTVCSTWTREARRGPIVRLIIPDIALTAEWSSGSHNGLSSRSTKRIQERGIAVSLPNGAIRPDEQIHLEIG